MNVRPDHLQVMVQSNITGPGPMMGRFSLINKTFYNLLFLSSLTKSFIMGVKGRLYYEDSMNQLD